LPDGISGSLFPSCLPEFENQPEIVIEVGAWFLSSFFGNYLAGFLGSFWERMPRGAIFLMLMALGIGRASRFGCTGVRLRGSLRGMTGGLLRSRVDGKQGCEHSILFSNTFIRSRILLSFK
jgi:hypothetical protein